MGLIKVYGFGASVDFFIVSGRTGCAICIIVHRGDEGLVVRAFWIFTYVCSDRIKVM